MAQGERLTKRERRERARAERKAQEAAAARRRRQRRVLTVIVGIASIAAVAVLVAVTRQPPPPKNIAIERTAATEAFAAAGCGEVEVPDLASGHLERANAPEPKDLYPVRPTSQGPHFGDNVASIGVSDQPLDERLTTHNLEHGAVVVWYDPDSEVDVSAIEEWASERNRAGFNQGRSGAGILVSPYDDDFTSGKAVALRAWDTAIDCDQFNPLVADALLIERFASHGKAPERGIAGSTYPEDVLSYVGEPPAPEPTSITPAG